MADELKSDNLRVLTQDDVDRLERLLRLLGYGVGEYAEELHIISGHRRVFDLFERLAHQALDE